LEAIGSDTVLIFTNAGMAGIIEARWRAGKIITL